MLATDIQAYSELGFKEERERLGEYEDEAHHNNAVLGYCAKPGNLGD